MSASSDPMDCSLPGFSVHGIFQARVLEWGAIAFFEETAEAGLKNLGTCIPEPGPTTHSPNTSLSRLQHPAKEFPREPTKEVPVSEHSAGTPFRGQQPM